MIYNNILETIGPRRSSGSTASAPSTWTMFVKIESFNPMASVKDRLAIAIIEDAEKRGC
jgi:cysteine synthase